MHSALSWLCHEILYMYIYILCISINLLISGAANSRIDFVTWRPASPAMSTHSGDVVCEVYDVRIQQHNLLQIVNDVNQLRVELQNEASVLKLGEMVLQWNQVEMASISLRKNSTSFNLVFASRDKSCFDFLEVSLAITPAAASLVQKIHENVEVASIPRALLVLPLRKLYGAPFRQVYWWYQVVANILEIMFALTFFVTLQRRFSSSAEGVFSSLGKLRDDLWTILTGEVELPSWLAFLRNTLNKLPFPVYVGSFFLIPVALPLQILLLLLNFHADILILTMLLPHVFLLWHSVASLVYAVRKTLSIILKIGSIGKSMSKGRQVQGNKKNS